MRLKAVIHEGVGGELWAEIPALPGCCAQGGDREELLENLKEAAEGCLLCGCDDLDSLSRGIQDDDLTIEVGG